MPKLSSLSMIEARIKALQRQARQVERSATQGLRAAAKVISKYDLSVSDLRRALAMSRGRAPSKLTGRRVAVKSLSPKVRLVVGVMATARHKAERTEQACIAFDVTGVVGLARKMFPTSSETAGRRYMSPCLDDFSAKERFIALPNGSVALLNSCYDMFGAADAFSSSSTRRTAIRALRRGTDHLTHRDPDFRSTRDTALSRWNTLLAEHRPDVLLASIHAFERPGLDGYWQRHGIARASARFGGALVLGAAHFLDGLPGEGSTLAAWGVPKSALSAGVSRRAYPLPPRHILRWTTKAKASAVLRLFKPTSRTAVVPGR
jgi:hypothetical protein